MPTTLFDVAINNARIIDGTGAPAVSGSIGIRDGLIAEFRLAELEPETLLGKETVDARGLTVSPGFIDLHSHADFTIPSTPQAITQITQGVTTILTGNCGLSPFPLVEDGALLAMTDYFRPDLDWSWRDAAGFAETLRRAEPAVNVALQVGHGSLRIAAMGDSEREPTARELERMCDLLRISADQGVLGFSTGLIYAPGRFARSDEVEALARVAAECGLLYSTHIRNETDGVLDAVSEAIEIASITGVRLEISHIKAMGPRNFGLVAQALELMDQARSRGVDVTADVYPYTASSTTLTSRLPAWALDGGNAALLGRLADDGQRNRMSAALATRFEGEIDPAGIVLAALPDGKYSGWIGHSLVEVAAAFGLSSHDAALDILAEHRCAVAIVNHAMADEDLVAALRDPSVSVASDGRIMKAEGEGRPHPRNFGTFTRVLGHFVRERGLLTLEEAIRKMTSLPASRAGMKDRGRIAEGMVADLTIFDPDVVADKSRYEDPWQLSEGISSVLLGGQFVLRDGTATGTRPGLLL